jgi:DNA-binding Lrp family transcriptional regulator
MDALERRLLNAFQRDFPLCEEPYASIAAALNTTEAWVLSTLRRFAQEGIVSRVGVIFRPGSVGASALAAMAVPPSRLADVARNVSAHPGVNHNYEREHRFNLWFVANAPDQDGLRALLARIEREAVLPVIAMPLVREYYIDLGFDLDGRRRKSVAAVTDASGAALRLDGPERQLVAALQEGLPLIARPFAAIATQCGFAGTEGERRVLRQVDEWLRGGIIKRVGVIVRHRPLGYVANVMAVWDVPDATVDTVAVALAREPAVTLCYRRARALPAWPYNLFCMMHGRERRQVDASLDDACARTGLAAYPHARLYSTTAFKQRGAVHFETALTDG